ncbi:polyprenyl synthetase family protein [uncultured Jatrophihabitans sp.]|uniref:polyprenyl synthetase family protein n=1 Tax=uncultured Jatrophihabitans sp. TaxID=1610747 RepID=UPI0035CC5192
MTTAALGVSFDDPALERSVRAGLDAVESALRKAVHSDDEFVANAAGYLVEAGGKRFRPLLSVLAAHFGDASRPEVVDAAVVCEITHLATLYHDDVMDEALVRRGSQSANARWDNSVAILTGDFLFSRASNILADLGPWAVRLQAQTFERLVIGQINETVGPRPGADPIEHYLSVLADKTGSLIATAAEFGAHFAGVDAPVIARLRDFGEQIGVAFQISDDILDIASESVESGKTPGTDLREGVPTLPVLYALRGGEGRGAEGGEFTTSATKAQRLRTLVSHPLVDDAEHAEALALLRSSPAIEQARTTLRGYADRARATLDTLPDVPARDALEALTQLVIARTG